ncbi:MAG: Spy/CpxP family protein refolding chaperone [Spirochaetia bacterium]|nr:Spy/CpxP family protein refolding chaperone [Spirochaetia bacterium]
MKKMYALIAIATVAVLVGANCRHPGRSLEKRAEWITEKIDSKLDLNSSQKQELDQIRNELVAKVKSNKPQMEQIATEFETLVRADSMDKSKLKDLQKRRDAIHAEMESLMLDKIVKFHAVLKPEQRAKAADSIKDLREHFMK